MPSIRPEIAEGELYHVYNRGVDKKIIFPNNSYYQRFIDILGIFNTENPVTMREYISAEVTNTGIRSLQKKQSLVDICTFILRPTHFHLLLRPKIDNGISLFMQKIGTGYTTFFNLRQNRSGVLFQSSYKIKLVDSDRYARHIQAYIPLNALDATMPEWREKGISNKTNAESILSNYKWSSFYSQCSGNNFFPHILKTDFVEEFFDDKNEYKEFVLSWTKEDLDFLAEAIAG